MEVCDRVSVLRDGELISTYKKEEFDAARFADDMVGREIVKAARHETQSGGQVLFSYEGLPDNQTLDILEGEILGITGLAGQGQENLLDGLFGMKKSRVSGCLQRKKAEAWRYGKPDPSQDLLPLRRQGNGQPSPGQSHMGKYGVWNRKGPPGISTFPELSGAFFSES